MDGIVAALNGKWSTVAAPDISCSRLSVATVVAIAVKRAAGDLAVDIASRGLRVDGERSVGILIPDLVDIGTPVVLEGRCIDDTVVTWRQRTNESSSRIGNAHGRPGEAVSASLLNQALANLGECGRSKTFRSLSGASIRGTQAHTEDYAHKIDVADVCEDRQVSSISELNKAPEEARTRILQVELGRLHQAIAVGNLDHEELEITRRKVDTGRADDNRHIHRDGVALRRQRNVDGSADRNRDTGASRAGIHKTAIAPDKNDSVVSVQAGNVRIDLTTGEVVDELDWQVSSLSPSLDGMLGDCR